MKQNESVNKAPYTRPGKDQLTVARGRSVPDLIAPALRVLFCGINPGLYSGAVGHHFARPGNRFWPALHESGFTPRRLYPWEEDELLTYDLGITNIVKGASASAAELSRQDIIEGAQRLRKKLLRHRPRVLAMLGIGVYRTAFGHPRAKIGLQAETIGRTLVWVLPNPSGLNAHFQLPELAAVFRELRHFAESLG